MECIVKRVFFNLKMIISLVTLIYSISNINAQANYKFDYQSKEGTHIYMSDENDFKIVEIDQKEEIIYQGDFSLIYREKENHISPILFFIFSHDGATIFKPSKVDVIKKYSVENVEIKLSNGEVLGNKSIGKISQGYGALTNVSVSIDPLDLYSNKYSPNTYRERAIYILGQLSKYDIVNFKIGDVSFSYDSANEDCFKTASIIKAMINDLRTKLKNKAF